MSDKLCRNRKDNFVENFDFDWLYSSLKKHKYLILNKNEKCISLDHVNYMVYISLHFMHGGKYYDQARLEERALAPTGNAQSQSPRRSGGLVPDQRVFRPLRSDSDEVRDAQVRPSRGRIQNQCRHSFRHVQANLLSGRSSFRARGVIWPTPQTSGTQGSAQAYSRGHGVHQPIGRQGRFQCSDHGPRDYAQTESFNTSQDDRASYCPQKKITGISSAEQLTSRASTVYEELRASIVMGQPRPEGVAALRYHGMFQGLAILLKKPPLSAPPPGKDLRPLARQNAFISQLANLVLYAHSEVTHVC